VENASLAERRFGLTPGSFPFESRFVDADGARIHYIDEGAGPVLLMLHGNPTWSYVFRHLIPLLRERFRCIVPDLPGFGLSSAPARYGFLPEEHARTIAAFIDVLALERFTPVMDDWGGPIGLYVAGLDPSRVERLIVGNTFGWPVNGDVHFELFSRTMGGPVGRFAITRFNAFVNLMIPAGIKQRPVTKEIMHAYRAPLPTPDARMPTYWFPRAILRSHAFLGLCAASLDALADKEALIVWGDADFAFRPKERERFEAVLPRHRTVTLPGAGHYIWEDAPDAIATAVHEWWVPVPGNAVSR
jgi:haloalkane dehalogenase